MHPHERRPTVAATLTLLDQSYRALRDGHDVEAILLLQQAHETDPTTVALVQGAQAVGALADPKTDPDAWNSYLQAAHASLNQTPTDQPICGPR